MRLRAAKTVMPKAASSAATPCAIRSSAASGDAGGIVELARELELLALRWGK